MAHASRESAVEAVDVPAEFAQALRELGLADAGERLVGAPLAGGVSSDIWRIDTGRGPICAKRALAKLRALARQLEDDFLASLDEDERAQLHALLRRLAAQHLPHCAP